MALLLPNYRKSIIDEIISSISSNTSYYYAVAANPVADVGGVPADDWGNKTTSAFLNWTMLFGKKLTNNDIMPMIANSLWVSNTVYTMYDDTVDLSNTTFYVAVTAGGGADYLFYKCIYNNNGEPSTNTPPTSSPQYNTITLSDGYMWRYVASVPSTIYSNFSANGYVPILPNNSIVSNAAYNSAVDVVLVSNGGIGYYAYHSGNIGTVSNSTTFQIGSGASASPNTYTDALFTSIIPLVRHKDSY